MPQSTIDQFRLDAARMLPRQFAEITERSERPWVQGIFDCLPRVMTAKRIALIGDAAALARPHVGAGTSKAAGDAMAFADALNGSETIDDAMAVYQAARLPDAQWLVRQSQQIGAALRLAG